MEYKTYTPHADLAPLVKCYWTLEVPPDEAHTRQRIIPDGCIEMIFILADDVKRYTSADDYIIQPRAMVLGHTIEPFFIEPTGFVNTFAVRFYPYGITHFIEVPLKDLANKETSIATLFEEGVARRLQNDIVQALNVDERIAIVEEFLLTHLRSETTIHNIVRSTVDLICSSKGGTTINALVKHDASSRRQLERKFAKEVGISPKQLGKVIRLQTALKMMLTQPDSLTRIAYESAYYDQAHFIRDFKQFTGTNPSDFLGDDQLILSTLFYSNDPQ